MKYINDLRELNLPKEQYTVFGSGLLAIYKLRENRDIDLLITKS